MNAVTLIFPHQLFKQHPSVVKGRTIYLVEEWLFFHQYNFHQQKIVLHRASMQFYKNYLEEQGFQVIYIDALQEICDIRKLIAQLAEQNITAVYYADVADNWLAKRIEESCRSNNILIHTDDSPNFLNTVTDLKNYTATKKNYFQTDFYIQQRKSRNILVDSKQQPVGGKWTFDTENRAKFPKDEVIPAYTFPAKNEFVKEAESYVQQHFQHHYGFVNINYPTTFEEAEQWLQQFMQQRFGKFGIYEDALVAKENFLYHSVLTPMLNIGLLNPQQVIDVALTSLPNQY